MILKIFSPQNIAEKLAFLLPNTAIFLQKLSHNIGFYEKRQYFRRKWAEDCDHNIDP
jgi:hypothetical protein